MNVEAGEVARTREDGTPHVARRVERAPERRAAPPSGGDERAPQGVVEAGPRGTQIGWRKEKPTVPGWYWYRGYEGPKPSCVYVEGPINGSLWLGQGEGNDDLDSIPNSVEWIGPISPPVGGSPRETDALDMVSEVASRRQFLTIRVYPYRRVYAWWGEDEDGAEEANGDNAFDEAIRAALSTAPRTEEAP